MRESRGLGEPSGRHLALPRVSKEAFWDPEPELGLETEEEEQEGAFQEGEASSAKAQSCDFSTDGRAKREAGW